MALSDMPADVEQAFNTLLQAELSHRRKQQQAKSQQAQQEQLMQFESQKLSNQMFQTALKGQLDTKSQQLKSAQQQSESTLEMHKFLSEQEDKRQAASVREKGRQTLAKLGYDAEQAREDKRLEAELKKMGVGAEYKSRQIEQKTDADVMLQEKKYDRMEGIAELNNSHELKAMNKKWGLKTTFSVGREAFKEKLDKLHLAVKKGIADENRESKEDIAKRGRALQRLIQGRGHTWKSFENDLNRKAKEAVARLSLGGKDRTRESSVKSLRDLEDMYKVMAASASGADMMNLSGGDHNDESRAYMAMMAAVGTAATEVSNSGGDWKVVLKKYLETNEVRIAIETSPEASERFATMELMLQSVSAPQVGVQGEEIPTGGGSIPTAPEQGSRRENEAKGKENALKDMKRRRGGH